MIALIIIFVFGLKRGLSQTDGKTKGPIHRKAITNAEVLKYHFSRGLFASIAPQCLHFIASSWISSAQ